MVRDRSRSQAIPVGEVRELAAKCVQADRIRGFPEHSLKFVFRVIEGAIRCMTLEWVTDTTYKRLIGVGNSTESNKNHVVSVKSSKKGSDFGTRLSHKWLLALEHNPKRVS